MSKQGRRAWAPRKTKAVQLGGSQTAGGLGVSVGSETGNGLQQELYHSQNTCVNPPRAQVFKLIPPRPGGKAWNIQVKCPICGKLHTHGWRSGPGDDLRVMRSAHLAQYQIVGFEPFEAAVWPEAVQR